MLTPYAALQRWYQSEEMNILINNNSFPRMGIEPTTVALHSHTCGPAQRRIYKVIISYIITMLFKLYINKLHINNKSVTICTEPIDFGSDQLLQDVVVIGYDDCSAVIHVQCYSDLVTWENDDIYIFMFCYFLFYTVYMNKLFAFV